MTPPHASKVTLLPQGDTFAAKRLWLLNPVMSVNFVSLAALKLNESVPKPKCV